MRTSSHRRFPSQRAYTRVIAIVHNEISVSAGYRISFVRLTRMNADECRFETTAHRVSSQFSGPARRIGVNAWLRRATAALIIALFGFSLISPVLVADPSPARPSCCLRDGKHHCAMDAADTQSDGPALLSRCALFSRIRCSLSNPTSPALPPRDRTAGVLFASSALPNTHECAHRRLAADAERKRGPPSRFA
jgi:hypothetical protein